MRDNPKFEKKLTKEDIQVEINKVGDFFKQIPEHMKAVTAENFIFEIVNWAARDHYQALGIFQEAMSIYRETSLRILAEAAEEEAQKEELENAFENAQDYRCLQKMDWMEDSIAEGEVCKIGCVGENKQYAGGKKYIIFREDRSWIDLCQRSLDNHFELLE